MFARGGPTFRELMQQAFASTQRGYDLLAPKFDKTPFRTPDAIVETMRDLLGAPGSVGSALDVCCGTGAALRQLRPLARERVVGIDFSEGMLEEARQNLATAPGDARVELVHGDALAMPFENEFDVATCVGALGHIEPKNEDRFVAGISRALRPGGRFAFATTRRPSPRELAFWLSHGFNAAMRVRNAIIKPEFVMYYLTFVWPEVQELLARHGLRAEAFEGRCPPPFQNAIIVVATKR
ncbi:MAG TPA: class I SAM-dependent methyltransferase [Kofleriaceae bacterium]|nr:class I SAM-dependent methyltransferase [Kofleriaceae bacterium]